MEGLSKKTTILLSPKLYKYLMRLARKKRVSLGSLIRTACEAQYGYLPIDERMKAVKEISALTLPVGSVSEMKSESVPHPEDLLQ
jgi:hypothetical protein